MPYFSVFKIKKKILLRYVCVCACMPCVLKSWNLQSAFRYILINVWHLFYFYKEMFFKLEVFLKEGACHGQFFFYKSGRFDFFLSLSENNPRTLKFFTAWPKQAFMSSVQIYFLNNYLSKCRLKLKVGTAIHLSPSLPPFCVYFLSFFILYAYSSLNFIFIFC